jgi:hypothetical protein
MICSIAHQLRAVWRKSLMLCPAHAAGSDNLIAKEHFREGNAHLPHLRWRCAKRRAGAQLFPAKPAWPIAGREN